MTDVPILEFTPTDKSRAESILLASGISDEAVQAFLTFWENEVEHLDAPRRAGSMVAMAYMRGAARVAVFGARCARETPLKHQFMAVASDAYDQAVADVAEAFTEAADEQTTGDGA